MATKPAYNYTDDAGRYESITQPTPANENRPPLTKKSNPGNARLLEVRRKRLKETKKQSQHNATQITSLQNQQKKATSIGNTTKKLLSHRIKKRAGGKKNQTVRVAQTAKAAVVAFEESVFFIFGYGVQVAAAALYTLAVYASEESWFGYVIPIQTIESGTLFILLTITVIFTLKAVFMFILSGTNFSRGAGLWTMPLCMLTLIPYLAFFPWILLWVWIVVWAQK